MTLKPLDPCPVCGGNVQQERPDSMVVCEDWSFDHRYVSTRADHRRLCAEVALARVVMEDGTQESERLWAAIARVREASK